MPSSPGYVVRCVVHFCEQLCLSTVEVVTDGEPAILELADAVKRARQPLSTRLRTAAAHSKGPVGPADAAIKAVGGQVRTLKLVLEEHYATRIDTGWTIFPWLVRHSAWLVARFAVRACGQTSYQQAFDAVFQGELAPFGERVLWHESASASGQLVLKRRKHKAESSWRTGVYLGRAERAHEHLVGTAGGIFKTRTVKRIPAEKGKLEELSGMRGTPWHPRLASQPGRRTRKQEGVRPLAAPIAAGPRGDEQAAEETEAQQAAEEQPAGEQPTTEGA